MSAYLDAPGVTLHLGDCLDVLREMPEASVDAVVTDPPYGLEFMGKEWDGADGFRRSLNADDVGRDNVFGRASRTGPEYRAGSTFQAFCEAWARELIRILKPGGHLLAFGGTRTYHRMTCAIEDAGFEIRDSLHWIYGTGFPKSLDVSKAIDREAGAPREIAGPGKYAARGRRTDNAVWGESTPSDQEVVSLPATDAARQWAGWGTALKPGHEPIVLARKPLAGTVAQNVQRFGTGALNVDACRIGFASQADERRTKDNNRHGDFGSAPPERVAFGRDDRPAKNYSAPGRWPANVLLDEDAAAELDAQSGERPSGGGDKHGRKASSFNASTDWERFRGTSVGGDTGGASRFFYVAKPSRAERDIGCEDLEPASGGEATDREDGSDGLKSPRAGAGRTGGSRNHHPTVKPVELMRYLVRLVTPPRGVVLDPFMGSGTTAFAAWLEFRDFIGIEREEQYIAIAARRAKARAAQGQLFEHLRAPPPEPEPPEAPPKAPPAVPVLDRRQIGMFDELPQPNPPRSSFDAARLDDEQETGT